MANSACHFLRIGKDSFWTCVNLAPAVKKIPGKTNQEFDTDNIDFWTEDNKFCTGL